ncbi:hypothetical protein EC80569_4414, partial [Escherichia coli 8.0569]
TGPP